MTQELLIYPDERINIACTDVRKFDEKLAEVIEDMKDTMKEYNLKALSAIQISYPYNIIVIKTEDGYDEYINPRIIKTEGRFEATESSSYYPNVTLTVPRHEKLKIIYEDKNANQHHKEITDREYSSLFQQMADHLYGGTFLDKVSKEKRDAVIEGLKADGYEECVGDVCPTFSRKDYFVSFTDKILFFMGLSLLSPLFDLEKETLQKIYTFDKIAFPLVIVLMIGFFIYAWYESKKYKQCSSCQIGNNIGVVIKRTVAGVIFAVASYFVLGKI